MNVFNKYKCIWYNAPVFYVALVYNRGMSLQAKTSTGEEDDEGLLLGT